MIPPREYAANREGFRITALKEKGAKDDGQPTHTVTYTEYARFGGKSTEKTEIVNAFQVANERKMLQDQIDRMTADRDALDVFLADCQKAGG